MILISHRGNLSGPNPELENSPDYIENALLKGFDVEIDVWWSNNQFWLGHDKPQYQIDLEFCNNKHIWAHAKDIVSLQMLLKYNIHCFFHQNDDAVLTSKGYIWVYPGKQVPNEKGIVVLPEWQRSPGHFNSEGICSDYIANYKILNADNKCND